MGENAKQQPCKRPFGGFCVSDVGQYGSFWGISSPVFRARRHLMTHSPCSAKREFVEPDPSRSPVRTRAAGHSHLLQPRWPTPEKGGTVSVARREAPPTRTPELLSVQKLGWVRGAPRRPRLCVHDLPAASEDSELTMFQETLSLGKQ